MAKIRSHALAIVNSREPVPVELPSNKISDYFGELAFDIEEMRRVLSPQVFDKVNYAIRKRKKIDPETADAIAAAVRNWAMSKGATHFTHWFQPLTGSTAEKHDAFFDPRKGIEDFKGTDLAQQEPDASSFPSGGIRSTFEARGYTAWDPSSPMYIYRNTLCIPTVFVSYTGEALDYKAPLLRAIEAVDKAATRVCKFFDRNITKVHAMLGWEQEYFVVDEALFAARPDLVMAGRTVFGHDPARGQQLDDHYFGAIPSRIYDFMRDFEVQAHRLGIPVRTRHNEVAPSQFEVAPMFDKVNVATDQNQLLKDLMERVAQRHRLKILFHEKPFAKLNGNGKHNNWSLVTDTGVNLFQTTSSARDNLMFLTFFAVTIKAVHEHADLLRASVASAGNDYRLGANEAPPAIISVFVGSKLTQVLEELEKNGNVVIKKGDNLYMKLGIDQIPEIIVDNTDRNRTSPFAFTGNKFEFRAVGGDANVSNPMTVLNAIVADQLNDFHDEVQKRISNDDEDKRLAMIDVLRGYIQSSRAIRFEGDGYSDKWIQEAAKRKLSNVKDTPRALDFFKSDSATALFSRLGIMTGKEIEARHEIMLGNYIMKVQIESRLVADLAINHVIPTAISYQNKLIENARGLKELGVDTADVVENITTLSNHISTLRERCEAMREARKKANKITDTRDRAIAYCDDIKEQYFEDIRYQVDKLEQMIDDEDWPLIKYRELLFLR